MKTPPGKVELHSDRVPEPDPTPGAGAVDSDEQRWSVAKNHFPAGDTGL